jgi:hypothetical protein
MCEQRSACLADQFCCNGGCSDVPCAGGGAGGLCQDPSQCLSAICCAGTCCIEGQRCCEDGCSDEECLPTCVNPVSCAAGQRCCSGFKCCNGSCIDEAETCEIA